MFYKPFFSVITITFNSERYLAQTIESIINQDYLNKEHIIIDGGSTDRTLDILKKYDKSIRWISEPDKGISDAMNKGIKMSKGEIISHLHSDDLYYPHTLSEVAEIFRDNPETMWLYGNHDFIDKDGNIIKKIRLGKYNYEQLKRLNYITHSSVFVKRDVFDELGYFDTSLNYAMDYDMWVRIGRHYDPCQTTETLSSFRFHDESLSSVECIKAFDEEYEIRLRNYKSEQFFERYYNYFRYRLLRLIKQFRPI